MEEQSPLFDICILCALPEEAEAVRNEFEDRCQQFSFQSAFTKKRKYPYWHAIFKNLREEPLTVLVMAMPFTGPVETPIFVQEILDEFRLRFIAMTGICAGDRNIAIGDLVVASYAFHHDVGKMGIGKQEYVNEETMPRRDAATRLIVDSRHAETALHEQQQTMHFADEKYRQEVKAQRKQFCVPVLISIHELAPIIAKLRQAHDDLLARQELNFQACSHVKQVNALFMTAQERAAVAGSELSIDPAGREVMDALIAYWTAQDEYIQAMLQPLRKVLTRFFGKTDTKVLDELAKKGDEKLTALEEAIRLYVNSP